MRERGLRVRPAAVAGMFYPDDPDALRGEVQAYMAAATPFPEDWLPKALVVPHAGYRFSAAVAAEAYAGLARLRGRVRRVVLIGPTHRVAVLGFALSGADTFETPLGPVAVDVDAVSLLAKRADATVMDLAHAQEHCLEVQLPFLRELLGADVEIVPILAGQVTAEDVEAVLESLWDGPETLIVVSSDLSHYLSYDDCVTLDTTTAHAIETLAPERIGRTQACGRLPLAGLMRCAKRRGMTVKTLDVRNSGDTAGPRGQVVGYGAWAFFEEETQPVTVTHGEDMLRLAAESIRHGIAEGGVMPLEFETLPGELLEPAACFVTLTRRGHLRGCVGSLRVTRSLAEDVVANAFAAAFRDPRFPPLTEEELGDLDVEISVLGPLEPLEFADEYDLLRQLEIGDDGLVIADHERRALFLPQVWGQLPDPVVFLAQLKIKAGLPLAPSPTMRAWRFRVDSVG